jgi:hypothetical protein
MADRIAPAASTSRRLVSIASSSSKREFSAQLAGMAMV